MGFPIGGSRLSVADDVRYNFSVYDVVRKGMPTSMRQGFDNEKYIELQAANIRKRIAQFGGKLDLEFGGKLFDDYHASRVLPGFEPDTKFRMLESLVDEVEIVIAINANAYRKGQDPRRPRYPLRRGRAATHRRLPLPRLLYVGSPSCSPNTPISNRRRRHTATASSNSASPACLHYPITGYPHDIDRIVSDDGYGQKRVHRDHPAARRRHRARPWHRQTRHRA